MIGSRSPQSRFAAALAIVLLVIGLIAPRRADAIPASRSTPATPSAGARASGGSANVTTFHLNVMALVNPDWSNQSNRQKAVDWVVFMVSIDQPIAVALNEICPSQVEALRSRLPDYTWSYATGYRASSTKHDNGNDCLFGTERRYGNAIGMKFQVVANPAPHIFAPVAGENTGGTHWVTRTPNVNCLATAYLLLSYTACSTHLRSPAPLDDRNDVVNMTEFFTGLSTAAFMLGDMNSGRSAFRGMWSRGHKDADTCLNKMWTTPSGLSKIDFSIGSRTTTRYANAYIPYTQPIYQSALLAMNCDTAGVARPWYGWIPATNRGFTDHFMTFGRFTVYW